VGTFRRINWAAHAEPLPGTAISLSDEERRRLFQALLRGEVSHHGSSLYGEIGDVVRNGLVTISGLHLARYLGTGVGSSLTSRGSGRSVPSRTGEAAVPRLIVRSLLAATVILMLVASSAEAGNHGGHGHGQARHHVVIVGGGGWWWGPDPWWWYYPPPYYAYPYYAYPPTVIIEQPPVYIEQRPTAPTPEQSWYYCLPTGAYYPSVQTCAEPWIKVTPKPE